MQGMRAFSLTVLLGLLVASCGGMDIRQDYDPAADLTALRSFNWQSAAQKPTGNELADSPLLHSRIRAALERELLAKGHHKVAANPDYLVAYSYTVEDGVERDPYDTRVGVGVGGGSHGTFGSVGVDLYGGGRDDERDTLVIDMIDPASGDLLWRGLARQRLVWHSDPEQNTARINATVTAILAQFPPRQDKD